MEGGGWGIYTCIVGLSGVEGGLWRLVKVPGSTLPC